MRGAQQIFRAHLRISARNSASIGQSPATAT
jgi:hypothetical protein